MAKYNLPHMNKGLLDEEPLELKAKEEAWQEVRRLIRTVPDPAPAPGFVLRWQERRAKEQAHRQHRQTWTLLSIVGGAAILLVGAWSLSVIGDLGSLKLQVLLWVFNLSYLVSVINSGFEAVSSFVATPLGVVSIIALFFVTGFATLASVLWGVAVKQLTTPRRVTNEDYV